MTLTYLPAVGINIQTESCIRGTQKVLSSWESFKLEENWKQKKTLQWEKKVAQR